MFIMKFLTKALLKSKIKSLGSLAVSVADHSLLGGAVSKYKGSDLSSKNKIPIRGEKIVNMIKEAEEKLINNNISDKQKYILNYKIETLRQIN